MASPSQLDTGVAIVLVANGPGELSTWVRPLAERLHAVLPLRPRLPDAPSSLELVLVPCPNATGHEHGAARSWHQFDRVVPASQFWRLLLRPRRYGRWPRRGVVVFLGGDQFWTVLLSARLGTATSPMRSGWPAGPNGMTVSPPCRSPCGISSPGVTASVVTVVGDLMADLSSFARHEDPLPDGEWIALLPGSKRAKLSVGMPFLLETADALARRRPGSRFLLPVAPTTSVEELLRYAGPENPIARRYRASVASVEGDQLITEAGTRILLVERHPAHGPLSQCTLALTTVGANTAELGALAVPMIVIVPTQHLEVMQAWDGGFGLLARLPGFRRVLGVLLTIWRLRNNGLMAWPNISAGRLVVPERVGAIHRMPSPLRRRRGWRPPIVWRPSARSCVPCGGNPVPSPL